MSMRVINRRRLQKEAGGNRLASSSYISLRRWYPNLYESDVHDLRAELEGVVGVGTNPQWILGVSPFYVKHG